MPKTSEQMRQIQKKTIGSKDDKLTIKQKRFIKHYLETGNGREATEKAGYNTKNVENSWSIAKQNLNKPKIQQAIHDALLRAELTPNTIANTLKDAILAGKGVKATNSDTLKGIDIYAKLVGAYNNPVLEQSYKLTLRRLPTKELIMELEKRNSVNSNLLQDIVSYQNK